MDSSLYVGAVSSGPLKGGDIAYIVGCLFAGIVYFVLAKVTKSATPAEHAGAGLTSEMPVSAVHVVMPREAIPETVSAMTPDAVESVLTPGRSEAVAGPGG